MWHEARKHEKKVREIMVDYQKRAERRREHYDKLKGDPHQLLRINGNRCKLHLDPKKLSDLDSTMIPWQGDSTNIISRYDVRIHLDNIPDNSTLPPTKLSREEKMEESRCSYERYRTLVQNVFHRVLEENALKQIDVNEMYPPTNKVAGKDKREKAQTKAAIGFTYAEGESDESEGDSKTDEDILTAFLAKQDSEKEKAFSSESEYEIDMDVDSFLPSQVDRLNVLALDYGILSGAFSKSLRVEKNQLEEQKQARITDREKANLSGRKSRRERKQIKEKQTTNRLPTPPTYARRGSPTYEPYEYPDRPTRNRSSSHSSSSESEGQVEFITEFGDGDAKEETRSDSDVVDNITLQIKPNKNSKTNVKRKSSSSRDEQKSNRSRDRIESSSSSRSRQRGRRSSSPRNRSSRRSRSGSRDYRRRSNRSRSTSRRRGSRSRSRSRERWHRGSTYRHRTRRSRSRSRDYHHRSSRRSRSHSRSPHRWKRSRSHSRSPHRRSHSRSPRRWKISCSHSRSPRRRSHSKSPRRRLPSRSYSHSRSRSPYQRSRKRKDSRSRSRSDSSSLRDRRERSESHSKSVSPQSNPSPQTSRSPSREVNPLPVKTKSETSLTLSDKKPKLTPKERLKKKMQAQLSKQYKMDKKVQQKKNFKKENEKIEREDKLRDYMKKVRDVRDRSEYTFSSTGESYVKSKSRSPSLSPVRHGVKDNKDSDFYYGRFL